MSFGHDSLLSSPPHTTLALNEAENTRVFLATKLTPCLRLGAGLVDLQGWSSVWGPGQILEVQSDRFCLRDSKRACRECLCRLAVEGDD